MKIELDHSEPLLEPSFECECEEKKVDPSISIVAGIENSIKKVALIKDQIQELANIKKEIIDASSLDPQDIVTLIVLLEKLNESKGLEVLKSQPSKDDLEQIKIVNGSIPAINALVAKNYEGVENPLKAIVNIYKNFEQLTYFINNLQKVLELWNSKNNIDKLSINLGTIEQVAGLEETIKNIVDNTEAIILIKDNLNKLLKLSEKIESIENIIDLETKIDEILTEKATIEAIYNSLDAIKRVNVNLQNVNTVAQNIDKLN